MVAVSDFSGLMSSAWALAKAEASAATDSLDRGMGGLPLQHIKAHRPRARALGPHPMADRLLGVVRYQGFELALRALFRNTREAFLDHERAKSELKALIPDDAKEAIGHGVRAKRSRSGAVSFDVLEREATHAPVQ